MHDYDKIAAIVGEDKINALREAGVNIADKPTKPTTGLLGRWAKDKDGTDVLIIGDKAIINGSILVAFFDENGASGAKIDNRQFADLTFPEETTRPEDVPVGEAWLVKAPHYVGVVEQSVAVKASRDLWITVGEETSDTSEVEDAEVTLIAPLVPARPVGSDREHMLETVTTEEEYAALPEGTIVVGSKETPWRKYSIESWINKTKLSTNFRMSNTTRTVLWKGRGE